MLDKAIEIIRETLRLGDMEINEDTNLKEDLGADSLDLFEEWLERVSNGDKNLQKLIIDKKFLFQSRV